jgi:hypothetical protein
MIVWFGKETFTNDQYRLSQDKKMKRILITLIINTVPQNAMADRRIISLLWGKAFSALHWLLLRRSLGQSRWNSKWTLAPSSSGSHLVERLLFFKKVVIYCIKWRFHSRHQCSFYVKSLHVVLFIKWSCYEYAIWRTSNGFNLDKTPLSWKVDYWSSS